MSVNNKAHHKERNNTKTSSKPSAAKGQKQKDSVLSIFSVAGWKESFSRHQIKFFIGLILLVVALFMLLSFISNLTTGGMDQSGIESGHLEHAANYGGKLGALTAYFFMNKCFGFLAFFIPLFLLQASMKLVGAYKVRLWKWFLNFSCIMIWASVTLELIRPWLPDGFLNKISFEPGGNHGLYMYSVLSNNVGDIGTYLILIALALCYLIYLSQETIEIFRKVLNPVQHLKRLSNIDNSNGEAGDGANDETKTDEEQETEEALTINAPEEDAEDENAPADEETEEGDEEEAPMTVSTPADEVEFILPATPAAKEETEERENFEVNVAKDETAADSKVVTEIEALEPFDPRKELSNYKFPTLDLLKKYTDDEPSVDMDEQQANKNRIIEILNNFGVSITSIKATVGPTITLYEITPAQGVRISKIRGLEDDIALSLSALGIRIIAPIPGKGTVGIEVPNKKPRIVSMESILNSKRFQDTRYDLPIAIGKTITNEVFMVDLAKMPHLLVAGATGQGKSVGLNAIITSLLYKKHPTELKFVMVDPKKVEFSIYAPLEKYFITKLPDEDDPIITDVTKVVKTLKSLCAMMDHRYDLLKKARVRNLKEYNEKFVERKLNPNDGHEYLPYIVIIIDEFGDLIMTAGKEVELPIARIAQLARAVGMHMVIATQRPTTNIITGTIKANFPARMAFKVSAQVDSRTILDATGANQLIGRGDLLFLSGMTGSDPVRVQCAFVDTPEVERINRFIEDQPGWLAPYELPDVIDADSEDGAMGGALDSSALDDMFEEAARLIVIHQQGSTSLLQRKFAVGYNRAGRLMDQLEAAGVVGPAQGSKPREVLISDENELDIKIQALKNR